MIIRPKHGSVSAGGRNRRGDGADAGIAKRELGEGTAQPVSIANIL